jgi:hypothetical protein
LEESWLLPLGSLATTLVSWAIHNIMGSINIFTGRNPTSANSESNVRVAAGSSPWQTESSKGDQARDHFKYQYVIDPYSKGIESPGVKHVIRQTSILLNKFANVYCEII